MSHSLIEENVDLEKYPVSKETTQAEPSTQYTLGDAHGNATRQFQQP